MRPIIWMSEPQARALRAVISSEPTAVGSAAEFVAARRDPKTIAFLDSAALAALDRAAAERGVAVEQYTSPGVVIAMCDEPLHAAIGWLASRPWLSHVVSTALLQSPLATEHLGNVMTTIESSSRPRLLDWVGPSVSGRRVRLARASRRVERLERMSDFLESKGMGTRTVQALRDVAEELLTNAFYDAPVSAGVLAKPISRTEDVALPDDGACDMVYGCRDDLAIVRVRDPFGSLKRSRLIEVLVRCARKDMGVQVDESMGGAGLGLWRIFSVATFVAISVSNQRHTEILVGISKKKGAAGPRPFALHLFFKEHGRPVRQWQLLEADTSLPTASSAVTLVTK